MTQRYRSHDLAEGHIEIGGRWWIQGTPDRVVGGALTVSSDGSRLELHGTLLDAEGFGQIGDKPDYPCVILGRAGTADVTLCNAYLNGRSAAEDGVHSESWSAFTTFVGPSITTSAWARPRTRSAPPVKIAVSRNRPGAPTRGPNAVAECSFFATLRLN